MTAPPDGSAKPTCYSREQRRKFSLVTAGYGDPDYQKTNQAFQNMIKTADILEDELDRLREKLKALGQEQPDLNEKRIAHGFPQDNPSL